MSNYLNVREVAHQFGVSEKTVRRHKENIPGFFRLFGQLFFDKTILFAYINEQTTKSTPKVKKPAHLEDKHGLF